jgi:hypothetical protein
MEKIMLKPTRYLDVAVLSVLLLFIAPCAMALDVKGKGDIPYDGSRSPDAPTRQKAIRAAKENAIKRHATTFNPAKLRVYQAIESEILANLDKYVIDTTVIEDAVNKDAHIYSILVRATINEPVLDARINDAGGFAKHAAAHGSNVSLLFVARETDSVKSFDARRTDVRSEESQKGAREHSALTEQGGATKATYNESKNSLSTTTVGGSTLQKGDDVKHRVSSASEIDAAMGEVFAGAGFEVVSYTDVASSCNGTSPDVLKAEFSATDEMSGKARKGAFDAARACDVMYFAVGTIDVGLPDTDPVSGNKRVYVSVRGEVWNISGKLPRRVASVGPVQYAGLGPKPDVARVNALKLAAAEGAKVMVDQLNAKVPR